MILKNKTVKILGFVIHENYIPTYMVFATQLSSRAVYFIQTGGSALYIIK